MPPVPSDLTFDAGTPPRDWIEQNQKVEVTARILSLWETTISLIANEGILGKDQRRFLAMIHDHKVSDGVQPTSPLQLKDF